MKSNNEILESVKDFLTKELGEYYQDIIEMEFQMSMEEFKENYMKWDSQEKEWVSLI